MPTASVYAFLRARARAARRCAMSGRYDAARPVSRGPQRTAEKQTDAERANHDREDVRVSRAVHERVPAREHGVRASRLGAGGAGSWVVRVRL